MRRPGRLLLLVVFGLALGVLTAELTLRTLERVNGKRHRIAADPILHHRIVPGFSKTVEGVPYQANALGLRDREYQVPKPAGVFRILMLGDSFTEGGGLRLEDTVAKRVERLLLARGCAGSEVVNAGVASYSPILEYLLLQHVGLGLQPDLIVLNFDMTDVHDDLIRTAIARLGPDGLPLAVPSDRRAEARLLLPPLPKPVALRFLEPLEAWLRGLAVYEALVRTRAVRDTIGPVNLDEGGLARRGLIGDLRYDRLAITRDVTLPDAERGWQLTTRYLLAIRDLARRHGIPFVLVVYPHAHQTSARESPGGRVRFGIGPGLFASTAPFTRLEALGRREGFPVIDLLPLFRQRTVSEGPLFRENDIHHTVAGARVFGEGIAVGLLEQRLVPACR